MAKQKRQALGNDPLFNPEGITQKTNRKTSAAAVTEEAVQQMGKAYKELRKAFKTGKAKEEDPEKEFTRMTFIVRKDHLDKLRDYAQGEQITIKEALDRALSDFLDNAEEKTRVLNESEFLKLYNSADEEKQKIVKMFLGTSSDDAKPTEGRKPRRMRTDSGMELRF